MTPTILRLLANGDQGETPEIRCPAEHWPMIIYRMEDNNESLRQVADEYGVSHETIHRIVFIPRRNVGN